jgi:hypothetical protein
VGLQTPTEKDLTKIGASAAEGIKGCTLVGHPMSCRAHGAPTVCCPA